MKGFKEYTAKLNEGFLDDDNEEQLTADSINSVKEEDTPFPAEDDDLTAASGEDDELDLSDEIGSSEAEDDKTEKEDLADLKLDELEDDDEVTDSGDKVAEEKEAAQETAERTADTMAELKDAIATLTTKIEALTDKVDNADEQAEATTEGGDDLGLDDLGSEGGDDLGLDDAGSEGGAPAEAPAEGGDDLGIPDEGSAEGSAEGGEGSSEGNEGGDDLGLEDENANEGSDEDFGEDESDNTKSEAYNYYMKKGKLLNSYSGSLIGKAVNEKLYDLDECFMNIAKSKIRRLIEAKKQELKENHFNY